MLRAVRLMRLFNEQLEALAKLEGKDIEQKVTVEHVHVYEGGQAIVGAVGHPGGREMEIEVRPHGRHAGLKNATEESGGSEMWRKDATGSPADVLLCEMDDADCTEA